MTTELIHNIDIYSKKVKMNHSLSKNRDISYVPYEEIVVVNQTYPNKYFLIHKNIVYKNNSIHDSKYEVYGFDDDGKMIGEQDLKKLGKKFFREMKVVKRLK